jgi:uncharacterized membrane protein
VTQDELFKIVLVLHVLGAVVALGFSLSYAAWLARGDASGGDERVFALETVSWIDRRVTTPAYVLQAVTGVTLVLLTDLDRFREAWLVLAIGIYVLLTVLAIVRFAPAHRRRMALAEELAAGHGDADAYRTAREVATRWGIVVTALTLLILVLMVWKPSLWS